MKSLFDNTEDALDQGYKNIAQGINWEWLDHPFEIRDFIDELYSVSHDLLDGNFPRDIKIDFLPRFAELYCAATFRDRLEKQVIHPSDHGPDFFLEDINGWIEVVCPNNGGLNNPASIPEMRMGEVSRYPWAQVLSRITHSFIKKAEKYKKYINEDRVNICQPMIIYISSCNIKEPIMYAKHSYHPVIKALFPIGDMYMDIGVNDKEVYGSGHRFKDAFEKVGSNSVQIKKDYFLNSEYSFISAVIFSSAYPSRYISRNEWGSDLLVVHNPLADNPLREGYVNCGKEWKAEISGSSFSMIEII